jgi:predicted AAA+ superfamily ATPase
MLPRLLRRLVLARLGAFPAVAILGPRQAGKTTLAKTIGGDYFDLEQEGERLRLDLEWESVLRSRRPAILDEAQAAPEIFPRLRGAIDAARSRRGRFLILGSVSPALMRNVSESLAGRLAACELSGFLLPELGRRAAADDSWLMGGFPGGGVLDKSRFPVWQREYLRLLAQRDLPAWGLPAKPRATERLFSMLAHVHGQLWNASHIAAGLGLSYHTVNSYAEYLAGAYLIRLLPPFHSNVRKRLVKSPKLYWRDSGLLHALLGAASRRDLVRRPWVGFSWEGWAIEQILSVLSSLGREHEAFFLRTQDGQELDLLLEFPRDRWAVELKLSSHPAPHDMERLNRLADWAGASRRFLVSRTVAPARGGKALSCSLGDFLKELV